MLILHFHTQESQAHTRHRAWVTLTRQEKGSTEGKLSALLNPGGEQALVKQRGSLFCKGQAVQHQTSAVSALLPDNLPEKLIKYGNLTGVDGHESRFQKHIQQNFTDFANILKLSPW